MAAELLRHQSSRAYYDSNHSGCTWGLLHLLDLDRHHRHKRKMITYKQHDDGNHGGGTKLLTSKQNVISTDQEHLLDKEAKFQMENNIKRAKKSSGASHLISLLYKKLTKMSKRKLKDSPSASQLLRTISIHHLECDDYVLPDDMISTTGSSIVELNSNDTDFSASSEQASGTQSTLLGTGVVGQNISVLSRDKNLPSAPNTTEEFLQDPDNGLAGLDHSSDLTQKIKDIIKEEHWIYMDGILDKIPLGHKLPDDAETEKESRSGDGPRSKFGSEGFVSTNSKLAQRSIQRSRSLTESLDKYSHLLESSLVREAQRLPQRSNSVKEKDSKLARRRFLSRSLSESLDRYSYFLEFVSVREPQRPQILSSVKEQDKNSAQRTVLWSHSLSESFDRYHLLESISAREPQRLPQRSNSVKEQDTHSAQGRILRSRSLSESFDRYPHLLESVSLREPKKQPERLKSIREENGLQDMKSQVAEVGSFSFRNDIPSEVSSLSAKEPDSNLSADDVKVDACISDEPNSVSIPVNTEESLETDSNLEQPEFIDKHDQGEARIVSDDLIADDSSIPQDDDINEPEGDPGDKPTESSPVSLLDLYIEEDPHSPVKYAELQGAELLSSSVHFEEQDSGVKQENKLSTMVELNKADSDKDQATTESEEDVEFNYVKDVLNKSGFGEGAEEFLAAWYSSCEPVDRLLFVEEPETRRDDSSFDQLLLLDLINEILLEVYESTVACTTGLLRFCPHIRPVPVGDHVLEEVWTKISRQLGSEQDMNHSIERIEARDYGKNDGWMTQLWDVERVGVYLEGLILDDLVDEIVVDLVDV